MRHRAPRTRLAVLRLSDPTRRGAGAAVALVVVTALTGVGVAVTSDDADPTAADVPLTAKTGTPEATPTPRVDGPPTPASRSGDRTTKPSPRQEPTKATSPTESPSTAESTPTTPSPSVAPSPGAPEPSPPSPSPTPVDDRAPDTTASTSSVGDDSWTISVGADEPATYECSLDSAAYQSCGSTTTFSGLDRGRHSVSVRATDEAGNTDSSPAQLTTTVNPAR